MPNGFILSYFTPYKLQSIKETIYKNQTILDKLYCTYFTLQSVLKIELIDDSRNNFTQQSHFVVSLQIMAELGERERINQELREEVHVMLDNARGLILSFKGPEAMRVQLNMQYDKFEAICSDRTRRYANEALIPN